MRRISITPRTDWKQKVEQTGLTFHSRGDPYWNEEACYEFRAEEVDALEEAANKLHELSKAAADYIIDCNAFAQLGIGEETAEMIRRSWKAGEPCLYGRFDFAYDGNGQPKLLEYNADTPTSLLEAAVTQWSWLEERFPRMDQFNSLHESLIARWKEMGITGLTHFTTWEESEEDVMTLEYLRDSASQAGLATKAIALSNIGHDQRTNRLVDMEGTPIRTAFKLYPWEWLVREGVLRYDPFSETRFIEPAWKMLWSNKGLLPILWEIAPNHPNLLPAYTTPGKIEGDFVRKPNFGREGANITLSTNGRLVESEGLYGDGLCVYQKYCPIKPFDGKTQVLGVWMIGDECHGMGIRESDGPITTNTSRFTPHYFIPEHAGAERTLNPTQP